MDGLEKNQIYTDIAPSEKGNVGITYLIKMGKEWAWVVD